LHKHDEIVQAASVESVKCCNTHILSKSVILISNFSTNMCYFDTFREVLAFGNRITVGLMTCLKWSPQHVPFLPSPCFRHSFPISFP